MGFFGFRTKMDKTIIPYIKINSKRKIPVLICYSGNEKHVKSRILSNSGKIKHEYLNLQAFACELSPMAIDKLSELPEVSYVCFDHKASLCMRKTSDALGIGYAKLLNLTGKGVGIGVIDSGAYMHPDLINQRHSIKFFSDLINNYDKPYDDNGHGTFICGCIAGSGRLSDGFYQGVAPDANLYVIKAFDATGNGFISDIVKGIDIILSMKELEAIRILCLPFEISCLDKLKINPLELIIEKACQANLLVVAPAGNHGPMPYSIYCPGNIREVLTVSGADNCETKLAYNKIANFSGRGPTINGTQKPDITTPCTAITSLSCDTSYRPGFKRMSPLKTPYATKTGTSISCALICGFAALLIERNPCLLPEDLKSILCLSTTSIGESKYSQGSGIFTLDKSLKQ